MSQYPISPGTATPLGVTRIGITTYFALYSGAAHSVTLCLFHPKSSIPFLRDTLSPTTHRTNGVWHIAIDQLPDTFDYGYLIDLGKEPKIFQNKSALLLDPYNPLIISSFNWCNHDDCSYIPNATYPHRSTFTTIPPFDWQGDTPPKIPTKDLIIYEMHLRGFTQDSSSQSAHPGKFLGLIDRIKHLKYLGINAIELMPLSEFNEMEYQQRNPITHDLLCNAWGYSPVHYFAPMNRYATSSEPGAAIIEFKTMVRELHRHGIELILDVVYNHTGEGSVAAGPTLSFRGIDPSTYYMHDSHGRLLDYSGCGNTFNVNDPIVMNLVMASLRYWVTEMHVDGFRFDLATALIRDKHGNPLKEPPLIKAIEADPILSKVKLIAEPWDAVGLYQVGDFGGYGSPWCEWNGQYRDVIRRFLKGTSGYAGRFAQRLSGSDDLYGNGRTPAHSINFVTSHDGFTLRDLVSYQHKHNLENGEHNRDGSDHNDSWNCGEEGHSVNRTIIALRERQIRNFMLALMVSQGVPMMLMGDEYGHTRRGNNNPWCQDNDLNWFQWSQLEANRDLFRFDRLLIQLRKSNQVLRLGRFLTNADVTWHGLMPFQPNWSDASRFVAFTLHGVNGEADLYVAFNAYHQSKVVELPPGDWHWVVNTAAASPEDILDPKEQVKCASHTIELEGHSAIVVGTLRI